jgi:hypothetical protein
MLDLLTPHKQGYIILYIELQYKYTQQYILKTNTCLLWYSILLPLLANDLA